MVVWHLPNDLLRCRSTRCHSPRCRPPRCRPPRYHRPKSPNGGVTTRLPPARAWAQTKSFTAVLQRSIIYLAACGGGLRPFASTRGVRISYHRSTRREPWVVKLAPGHPGIREDSVGAWVTATGKGHGSRKCAWPSASTQDASRTMVNGDGYFT